MAQRRMFSLKIIGSARFLKMPVDSRELYFQLGLHADDDGVVEAYPLIKILGSSEDNLRVLVSKNFIKILNEDLVSYVMDWNEHNLIRADRKVDSIYKNLLLQVLPDIELLETKPRSDLKRGAVLGEYGQSTDSPRTDDGQHRLGKVRLGKVSKEDLSVRDENQKDLRIVKLFAFFKGIDEKSPQFSPFIKRNRRAAKGLVEYEMGRIEEVMGWLKKNADFKWALETVGKYIDEDLKSLEEKKRTFNGDFQCGFGHWHKKGEVCGHIKINKSTIQQ